MFLLGPADSGLADSTPADSDSAALAARPGIRQRRRRSLDGAACSALLRACADAPQERRREAADAAGWVWRHLYERRIEPSEWDRVHTVRALGAAGDAVGAARLVEEKAWRSPALHWVASTALAGARSNGCNENVDGRDV